MPAYKIASGDLLNTPLIRHVASFGKPVIISTGGGNMTDVKRAYDAVSGVNDQACIMQCTSGYPPEYDELNLRVIDTFRAAFPETVIGYSGHDNGIAMPLIAYMLGARIVEKHFTLNRSWKGTDHAFSLAQDGMRKLVRDLQRAHVALGDGQKRVLESEVAPLQKMGKKLVAARSIPAGHALTDNDICIKSPGDGIPPYELDNILGKVTDRPIAEEDNIMLEDLRDA
jgi:N-acetylneuraminate synthase/sialic acid synthase